MGIIFGVLIQEAIIKYSNISTMELKNTEFVALPQIPNDILYIIHIFREGLNYYEHSVGHRVADSIMKANPGVEKKTIQIWTYD